MAVRSLMNRLKLQEDRVKPDPSPDIHYLRQPSHPLKFSRKISKLQTATFNETHV
jgi:hypothetical protein